VSLRLLSRLRPEHQNRSRPPISSSFLHQHRKMGMSRRRASSIALRSASAAPSGSRTLLLCRHVSWGAFVRAPCDLRQRYSRHSLACCVWCR